MRYWLMKSEPDEFSVDDLEALPDKTIAWEGVRNYQSRNFMRNQMAVGDQVFFYHSCCKEPGIVAIAVVSASASPMRHNSTRQANISIVRLRWKIRAGSTWMSC